MRFVDIGRGLGRSGMRPVHSWPFHFYSVAFVCSRPVFWSKGGGGGRLKATVSPEGRRVVANLGSDAADTSRTT